MLRTLLTRSSGIQLWADGVTSNVPARTANHWTPIMIGLRLNAAMKKVL